MTDFSTEILPDEEEMAEELLPREEDEEEAHEALDLPGATEERHLPALAGAGNAVLSRQLADPKPEPVAATPPQAEAKQPVLAESSEPEAPASEPAEEPAAPTEPQPAAPTESEREPILERAAERPQADPAAERRKRLELLAQTVARLAKAPEGAPTEALFAAYLEAPTAEQAEAARAVANAVLRIDADARRRARITLARAMAEHASHPLAGMLALRLGAWVSASLEPAPPPEPEGDP